MSEQEVIPIRPKLDEARTPFVWCHRCFRTPVAFDFREDRQLCDDCRADEPKEAA